MSLWLAVRRAGVVVIAGAITLSGLVHPWSLVTATPSPAGAAVAAACFLALIVPIVIGWGCGRGDAWLEVVSVRPIHGLDLALGMCGVGVTAGLAMALHEMAIAPAGLIAGRGILVDFGLMLGVTPLVGWRTAAVVPAAYLLAVAVVGRGDDALHPAGWAWIAADGAEPSSWVLTIAVLGAGIGAYLVATPRWRLIHHWPG